MTNKYDKDVDKDNEFIKSNRGIVSSKKSAQENSSDLGELMGTIAKLERDTADLQKTNKSLANKLETIQEKNLL